MSEVRMCDCCGNVFDIDHINPVDEEIIDFEGHTFIAEDDICDECLDDLIDQMGFEMDPEENNGFWIHLGNWWE